MSLLTESQLAEDFGITEEKAAELRRRHRWPHVRLSRFEVRYTEEQVRLIVAKHSHTPAPVGTASATGPITGQSPRSAARKRTG